MQQTSTADTIVTRVRLLVQHSSDCELVQGNGHCTRFRYLEECCICDAKLSIFSEGSALLPSVEHQLSLPSTCCQHTPIFHQLEEI